jgi:hypothetical protein
MIALIPDFRVTYPRDMEFGFGLLSLVSILCFLLASEISNVAFRLIDRKRIEVRISGSETKK